MYETKHASVRRRNQLKQWKVLLCNRYRLLLLIVSIFSCWIAVGLAIQARNNWRISRFQSLKSGMSRSELIKIVGEPQRKEVLTGAALSVPTINNDGEYVEYFYFVDFASTGGIGISGIFLDKSEERIEFIKLRTELIDDSRIGRAILALLACAIIALPIWILLTKYCGRRDEPNEAGKEDIPK